MRHVAARGRAAPRHPERSASAFGCETDTTFARRVPMRARKAYAAPAALAAFLITASSPVLAQTGQSSGSAAGVASSSDPRPIQDLMKAAQQLRDATHDLVREQPSARRNA